MQGPPQAPPIPQASADSWEDHLRQHVRMTMTVQALDRRLRALQEDGTGPVVRHYLYARPPEAAGQ